MNLDRKRHLAKAQQASGANDLMHSYLVGLGGGAAGTLHLWGITGRGGGVWDWN